MFEKVREMPDGVGGENKRTRGPVSVRADLTVEGAEAGAYTRPLLGST